MASITIRNLDDEVRTRLRMRAAGNGRSMEEEVRLILRDAVGGEPNRRTWPTSSVSASRPAAAWISNYRRADRCVSRRASIEEAAMVVLDTNVLSEFDAAGK